MSIEKEIERTKGTYYEALAASSIGWQDGENDYTPFVTYMPGVLKRLQNEGFIEKAGAARATFYRRLLWVDAFGM